VVCPTCKKEFDPPQSDALPFCCERCRLIDLGRWLGEDFGLPSVPDPEADETPETFGGDDDDDDDAP
jgi:endogenous inhibitor of DNA gyrase (YacG/DUF329 family)